MNKPIEANKEYIARLNKTFDFIEQNLEKPLTLEALAEVANFSKYHFNRIFRAMTGETPFQFILRLRLEKAASFMPIRNQESISDIAFKCGFTDISIFSRNFKKYYGVPPSQYRDEKRQHSNLSQVDSNLVQSQHKPEAYFCPDSQTIKWRTNMDISKGVEVKKLPEMTVAYIRNVGAYDGDQTLYKSHQEKLFAWAGARNLLGGDNFKYLMVYHDNPKVALSNNLRSSLSITVPPDTKVEGEIGKMVIAEGTYAVCHFELTQNDFQTAWNWAYGEWLPQSGYQPDDKPYFEDYLAPPQEGKFVVDFCIPVKPI